MKDPSIDNLLRWLKQGAACVEAKGLSGPFLSCFFSRLMGRLDRPCLVIAPEVKEAKRLYDDLLFFTGREEAERDVPLLRIRAFFPYDMSPLTGLSPATARIAQRIEALHALISDARTVVITCPEALCFRMMPKEAFVRALEYVEAGEEMNRDDLVQRLETAGYQRSVLVEEMGDYAVRGGVIDVFSPLHPMPVRLEFWGDRIESIRHFDPLTQRSTRTLKEFTILPATEIITDEHGIRRARSMGRLPVQAEQGCRFPGQEAWLNHFYATPEILLNYLPERGMVVLVDGHRLASRSLQLQKRFLQEEQRFRKEMAEKVVPYPDTCGLFVPLEEVSAGWEEHQKILLNELSLEPVVSPQHTVDLSSRLLALGDLPLMAGERGTVSMGPLASQMESWVESGARVVLICSTEQQSRRFQEIMSNYQVPVAGEVSFWYQVPRQPGLYVCLGYLREGFRWPEEQLYVISENEIFGPRAGRLATRARQARGTTALSGLELLKEGDFVVHEEHGIGQYQGLSNMEVAGQTQDFVLVAYADNARLYLPADRISVLEKYAGADERAPKLDQLGGRSWDIAKEKAGKSIRKIARQLVDLYAVRTFRKGQAFSPPDAQYREFEATFEHEETDDQIRAIEDVLADLTSEKPMDRLVCGDVGFGKTEIAVRAAFKAVSDGKQTAMLVPTTVLAEQHFETVRKRMAPFGIEVDILSRFKTRAEQAQVIAKVRSGKTHVLIGTHRILQKDVHFADLGLLIIDEEQRFGVKQKEALKKFRALVDVLAITATPVPRTLQLSMVGVRDMSVINTPPENRVAIETHLSPYDEGLIRRAIEFEIARGGQIFFVHNRVQTIDHMAEGLMALAPSARFAVAHGQMKAQDLEETMMRFLQREVDVLVCSTIIESGLDIPSANTIIIHEADRLGLAQIYQLRGRVGRSSEKAYAYLLVSNGRQLTRDAEKRLKALMDFSHLGAGLHLAMHDLKIRGGGNILGFAQSGHISAIGYSLYLKLIERAITELKGEEWEDDINPELHLGIPAYLPGEYVIDGDMRLNLYRRFSSLIERIELEALIEEIRDRFGTPPQEAENLFGLMAIRLVLKKLRILRLDAGDRGLILTLDQGRGDQVQALVKLAGDRPGRIRFLPNDRMQILTGPLTLPEDLPRIEQTLLGLESYLQKDTRAVR